MWFFILATTEARKVPLILSRCQRYDFRTIGEEEMLAALENIAQKEKADITEDALELFGPKSQR